MRFFCITDGPELGQNELLRSACAARNVTFQNVDASRFDYSVIPVLSRRDLVYRSSSTQRASFAEVALTAPTVTTFRSSSFRGTPRHPATFFMHKHAGVPIPKTIPVVTADREQLQQNVEEVGGFPLILKALGGSHGVGVMKIDSFKSLVSVVEYALARQDLVVLRQFIPAATSARLIVLGDRVVDSIAYHVPDNDFRSNTGAAPHVVPQVFSQEIQDIACRAVRAVEVEFGGVDILIDEAGNKYVTEINFPCNFARAQRLTNTDIAGMMIEYLQAKAERR